MVMVSEQCVQSSFQRCITKLSTILWWLEIIYSGGSPAYEYQKYGSGGAGYPIGRACTLKIGVATREAILLIL